MAETSPTIRRPRRRARPETSAWVILVCFFLLFCALVAWLSMSAWGYYTTAMTPINGTAVRVHVPTGVYYQQKGTSRRDTPVKPCDVPPTTDTCQTLNEDDRVIAVPQAGYGPVSSITMPDGAQIDMYAYPAGAELALKTYRVSRWTMGRHEVRVQHNAGYARYDIPGKESQPFGELSYTVELSRGLSFWLAPGGSYSVDVPLRLAKRPPRLADSGQPLMAEIAVRTGSAEVRGPNGVVLIQPDQKLQIDDKGQIGEREPARWDLIRDGNFAQYVNGGYPKGTEAWLPDVYVFDQSVTNAEKNAQFRVYTGCPPATPAFCSDNPAYLAQFQRLGNQSKSFGAGVKQQLDMDISEYRALHFTMWARVVRQSIPNAGITNVECPVTVRITFKQSSPTDNPEQRYICFYRNSTGKLIPPSGQFVYQAVDDLPSWYQVTFDLRDPKLNLLASARYIDEIFVYGNGHDYISEVTDISLIAAQTR